MQEAERGRGISCMGSRKAAGHAVRAAQPPGTGRNTCGAGPDTGRRLKPGGADRGWDAPGPHPLGRGRPVHGGRKRRDTHCKMGVRHLTGHAADRKTAAKNRLHTDTGRGAWETMRPDYM